MLAGTTTLAAAASTGVPVLRVTAPNGETSILIGLLHVPVQGLREPDPTIFAGARSYVVEHGASTLPPETGSVGWAAELTSQEVAAYLRRATCNGRSEEIARSALAEPTPHTANAYAYTICPLPQRARSRDEYLNELAKERHLVPLELEDGNWVESQRRMVSTSANVSGFRWSLAHDPKAVLEQTRDELNAGDYAALRTQVLESFGSPEAAEEYSRHMLEERNAEWRPRLERVFVEGHAVVAVGAMHFPGPSGLIALLRRDGYAVDVIEWPAAPANSFD